MCKGCRTAGSRGRRSAGQQCESGAEGWTSTDGHRRTGAGCLRDVAVMWVPVQEAQWGRDAVKCIRESLTLCSAFARWRLGIWIVVAKYVPPDSTDIEMHYGIDTCGRGVLCLCGELLVCALIQGRMSCSARVHYAYAHLRISHAHRGASGRASTLHILAATAYAGAINKHRSPPFTVEPGQGTQDIG